RERLEGSTVIVVSHQASTLERFCSRGAVLKDGQLTMYDTLEEAKWHYEHAA
ncbi:MAG: ABC transporter, partial [Paracoccaceae bacterium]